MPPSKKGNQVQVTLYLPPETAQKLKELSEATRIPQAALFREAIEDLLKKHRSTARAKARR